MSDDGEKPVEAEYIGPKGGPATTAETSTAIASTASSGPTESPTASPAASAARSRGKSQERALQVVQRADRKLRRSVTHTMAAVMRAPEIDPNDPMPPEGWTVKDWRIARAAWLSVRECPAFITLAEKTLSTFVRAEAQRDSDPSPQLNCDIQVFVQANTYVYDTVDNDGNK